MDKKEMLERMNANRNEVLAKMKQAAQSNPNMDPKLRAAIEKIKNPV